MPANRALGLASLVVLLVFVANFAIFVLAYGHLAVPFLSEAQRVTNANFIMSVITSAFAIPALLVGGMVYWTARRAN